MGALSYLAATVAVLPGREWESDAGSGAKDLDPGGAPLESAKLAQEWAALAGRMIPEIWPRSAHDSAARASKGAGRAHLWAGAAHQWADRPRHGGGPAQHRAGSAHQWAGRPQRGGGPAH